jgi:hypothetical protein
LNPTFLYVAFIFFGAVWLWNRWSHPLPWKVAALFYLLVLGFLFRPMVLDTVGLPVDYIQTLQPWKTDLQSKYEPLNPELNDLPLQIVPWAHLVRESWKSFEAPLWNDAATSGYPLLASAQSAALGLLRLLSLPLSLGNAFTFEAAMKLLLALCFTFLFMRTRGAGAAASIVAAISFGFSSAMLVWLNFPLGSVIAFLPATFFGIELCFRRQSWPEYLFLTIVFSQILLHGHPESAAHIVFASSLWVLFRLLVTRSRHDLRAIGCICLSGISALLLSSPFLLPFFEALPYTLRFESLQHAPGATAQFHPRTWVTLIQPSFFGSVREGTAWGPAHAEVISGFAGIFAVAAWVGLLVDLIRRRRWLHADVFFLAAAAVLLLISIGAPVISHLFESLPLFSLAANSRLRFVVCFFLAILAGRLVQIVEEGHRAPAITGLVVALVLLLLPFGLYAPTGDPLAHAARTTLPGLLVLLLAIAGISWRMRPPLLGGALSALILLELCTFGIPWNPVVPREMMYPSTPLIERLKELVSEDEMQPARITAIGATLFPNTSAIYGFQDIRGHDPMASARLLGMLRVFTGYTSERYFGFLPAVTHPYVDFLNTRYVLTSVVEQIDEPGFELVYIGEDGRIYRNHEAIPRFFAPRHIHMEFEDEPRIRMLLDLEDWRNAVVIKRIHSSLIHTVFDDVFGETPDRVPTAKVEIVKSSPRTHLLRVEAVRWSLVASSQPVFPGWRIYDGKGEELKLVEVNEAFIGFFVPPGTTSVRIEYRPRSYYNGLWLAGVMLLLIGAWPWVMRLRARRFGDRQPETSAPRGSAG